MVLKNVKRPYRIRSWVVVYDEGFIYKLISVYLINLWFYSLDICITRHAISVMWNGILDELD